MPRKKELSTQDVEFIVSARLHGLTIKSIAGELETSSRTVQRYLIERGVISERQKHNELVKQYMEIISSHGLSPQELRAVLKERCQRKTHVPSLLLVTQA